MSSYFTKLCRILDSNNCLVCLLPHSCYSLVLILPHCCYSLVFLLPNCCFSLVLILPHCCYSLLLLLPLCYSSFTTPAQMSSSPTSLPGGPAPTGPFPPWLPRLYQPAGDQSEPRRTNGRRTNSALPRVPAGIQEPG